MMEATDLRQGDDFAEVRWLYRPWFGRVLRQRKVSSRPVVIAKVAVQLTTKMFLAEDDHMVEEVPPDGPDHALGVGVLPWRPRGGENFGDAHAFRASSKGVAIDGIAIAKEVPGSRVVRERLEDLLGCPGRGRFACHVEVDDLTPIVKQHDEHEEDTECRGGHDQEVDSGQVGDVVREEGLPRLRGWPSPPRHDPGDRALRNCEAQLEELAMDPGRASERVGVRHLPDQGPQLRAYRRAPWPSMPRLPCPPGAKALAMPADDGRRLYQDQSVAPARPAAGELNPEGLVEPSELRPLRAVVQESELLPKGKVLEDQIPAPSQGRAERPQQGDNDGPHGLPAWSVSQVAVKSGDPILAKDSLYRPAAACRGVLRTHRRRAGRALAPVVQLSAFDTAARGFRPPIWNALLP
jgi:hypothetical protein